MRLIMKDQIHRTKRRPPTELVEDLVSGVGLALVILAALILVTDAASPPKDDRSIGGAAYSYDLNER